MHMATLESSSFLLSKLRPYFTIKTQHKTMDDGVGANEPYCRPMHVFGMPRNLYQVGPEHISFTLKVWSPYEDAHEGVAFG